MITLQNNSNIVRLCEIKKEMKIAKTNENTELINSLNQESKFLIKLLTRQNLTLENINSAMRA